MSVDFCQKWRDMKLTGKPPALFDRSFEGARTSFEVVWWSARGASCFTFVRENELMPAFASEAHLINHGFAPAVAAGIRRSAQNCHDTLEKILCGDLPETAFTQLVCETFGMTNAAELAWLSGAEWMEDLENGGLRIGWASGWNWAAISNWWPAAHQGQPLYTVWGRAGNISRRKDMFSRRKNINFKQRLQIAGLCERSA